ncbi:AraC family transcriptional regulator [Streptomyces marincola]|uniref:AraC family transcriptional regulator n=1 Tax=Streptomyces marincola TaxID=2878388 RepID=A0A1W7CT62_9ACTN|nr:GyrI-like domain-containing protein [Streptomyces marincola]ARQ67570.1 AraC family transcriptional regulator [Streptomyces marincola]
MLDRLNEAMEHIESRLDGTVDAAELARIAWTSEYHLRRMFSALAGIPLSEYVRRRRLTVAGAEVLAGERPLLEIALRYGYGSGEAFARAFRAHHGIGPGAARRTGAALRSQPRMSFRLIVEGSSTMRYRVVEMPDFHVVGARARVPLVHEGINPAIAAFIRGLDPELVASIEQLSDSEPSGLLAVVDKISDGREEGTELDYYHAVLRVADDAPADLDTLHVPAGKWAVFENSGPFPEGLQTLWRDVFTQWFPANPYESRPGPEMLRTAQLREGGTQAETTLWIPVTPTGS